MKWALSSLGDKNENLYPQDPFAEHREISLEFCSTARLLSQIKLWLYYPPQTNSFVGFSDLEEISTDSCLESLWLMLKIQIEPQKRGFVL